MEFREQNIRVACDYPGVPEDDSNLAYQAAEVFYKALSPDNRPIARPIITIFKRIPPGGGLGGGSSNAATVLTTLNQFHGFPFTKAQLMRMGLSLGADVPFFIFGGPAIVGGIGDQLTPSPPLKPLHAVLCYPGIGASTGEVFKKFDFELTPTSNYNINSGLNMLLRGQGWDGRTALQNDLEVIACRLYPEIRETKKEMELLLGTRVQMTGSGSSLFALFSDCEQAEKGYGILLGNWVGSKRKIFLSSFN